MAKRMANSAAASGDDTVMLQGARVDCRLTDEANEATPPEQGTEAAPIKRGKQKKHHVRQRMQQYYDDLAQHEDP